MIRIFTTGLLSYFFLKCFINLHECVLIVNMIQLYVSAILLYCCYNVSDERIHVAASRSCELLTGDVS
jgi:hypothetical protein